MAARRPARIPQDLALQMIQDGWDEEPIWGTDSGSDISDVEDPDYCPPGDVRPPGNQPPPTDQGQSDTEESSDESSEEEMDIVSNRMTYWSELPPSQAKTPSYYVNWKILRYSPFLARWWQEDQSLPTGNRPHGSFPLHMGPVPGQLQAEIHPQWLCYSGWTTCAIQREHPVSAVYAKQAGQVWHKDLLGVVMHAPHMQ